MTENTSPQVQKKSEKPLKRIPTIDFLKGISLICVFYAHTSYAWFTTEFISFSRFQWYLLDAFGPVMFVTLSMVGNMVGIEKRRIKGETKLFPAKNLIKVSYLLLWGELINFFNLYSLGLFHLSAWNVITAIGIFTLVLPVFLKMKPIYRLILVGIIAITYYPIVEWTFGGFSDAGIRISELMDPSYFLDPRLLVYWFFFDHRMMCPIFSWLIIPLLTSVVFDGFIKAFARGASREELGAELRKIGYYGLVLIAGAVTIGMRGTQGFIEEEIGELMTPGFFVYPFTSIPQFWVDDCPEYIFYNLGVVMVLFSTLGHRQCIKGRVNSIEKKFINAGVLSFTAFMVSHVAYIFPIKVIAPIFYIICPAYIIIFILIFDFWRKELKSLASIEWLLGIYQMGIFRLLKRTRRKGKGTTSRT
ncbi:MAG: hypothetical protein ACTSUE_17180 [Promethearchaeota archaeon]